MSAERAPSAREALEADYEIVRQLGAGGTSIVYLARNRVSGEEVAIKLIRSAYLEDEEALARFAREARHASRLDHPNVLPVREVLPLGGGGVALVMAHVPGRTLKRLIRDEGALTPEHAERILRDVAAGLSAAHALDVIHRDVKPENIFIDESGRALLADFGLARSTKGDTAVTMTGVAIGTPTYMPPEQIDGGVFDARGDVYSLGLVAWEMLTGKRPWDGDSLYTLLYHQKHDYLPDVREFRQDVPDVFADVIATAIEKSPDSRWQSVAEMIAALDGVVPVRTPSPRPVTSDTMRIARTPVGAAAIVFDPEPAFETPPRRHPLLVSVVVFAVAAAMILAVFGLRAFLTPKVEFAGAPLPAATGSDTASSAVASSGAPVQPDSSKPAQASASVVANRGVDSATAKRRLDSVAALAEQLDSSSRRTAGVRDGDVAKAGVLQPTAPPRRSPAGSAKGPHPVAPSSSAPAGTVVVPTPPAPRPPAPAPAAPVTPGRVTIVAGGMHTCFVGAAGRGYCWGSNTRGQLGTSSNARAAVPTLIGGNLDIASVAAGLSHSCAIARGGAAWCWGENDHGQLGDRSSAAHGSPIRVVDGHSFHSIAAGASHSCGLDNDGTVWCWGAGSRGQLGNGATKDSNIPVKVANGHFTSLVAGWNFNCALDGGGRAYCWGENDAGQLGVRDTLDRSEPTIVSSDLSFVSVAAGAAHACGLTSQGDAYCWGKNSSGQLGDGTTSERPIPTRVKADVRFVSIAAGAVHTCAIDVGSRAFCWGLDAYGQLGDGGTARQLQPVPVSGGHTFASLTAFGSHTCGTTASGDAFCWGYNLDGQLGDGTRINRLRPVYLEPLDK